MSKNFTTFSTSLVGRLALAHFAENLGEDDMTMLDEVLNAAFDAGVASVGGGEDMTETRPVAAAAGRGREEVYDDGGNKNDGRHTNPTFINGRQWRVGQRVYSTSRKLGGKVCEIIAFRPDTKRPVMVRPNGGTPDRDDVWVLAKNLLAA